MIAYQCLNERAYCIFTRGNFHFYHVRRVAISRHGLLLRTTSGLLPFFSVSRSDLWKVIVGGGITLNFIRGPWAISATALRIQEKMHCGIYFVWENALWGRWYFSQSVRKFLHIASGAGWPCPKLDAECEVRIQHPQEAWLYRESRHDLAKSPISTHGSA